jgi:uncharacterized membrane protein YphA (DoxX/SURF4 family)
MTLRRLLLHPWLRILCQIALGGLFIAAALPKLQDPPGFAKALWAYRLFPGWSIHPLALVLPWFELLCGLALGIGAWKRAAAASLATLLLGFILALSVNLARRHPVDCGCFSTQASTRSDAERLAEMRWTILRDLGMLLLAAQILAATWKRETP